MRVRIEFDSRRGRIAFRCGITAAVAFVVCSLAYASQVGVLNTFSAGQVISSSAINTNFTALKVAINDTDNKCGDLTTLATTAKTSLVAAVNEVNGKIPTGTLLTSVTADTTLKGNGTAATPLGVDLSVATGLDGRYLNKVTGGTVLAGVTFTGPVSVLNPQLAASSLFCQGGAGSAVNQGGQGLVAVGGAGNPAGFSSTAQTGGDGTDSTGGNGANDTGAGAGVGGIGLFAKGGTGGTSVGTNGNGGVGLFAQGGPGGPGTGTAGIPGLAGQFSGDVAIQHVVTPFTAGGNLTVDGNLSAGGTAQLGGLTVPTGSVTFGANSGTINIGAGGTVSIGISAANIGVSGATNLTGNLDVTGVTTVTGDLGVTANTSLGTGVSNTFVANGNVTLGTDNTNTVTIPGNLSVTGNIGGGSLNVSAATKNFKIDHPLDPENKFLFHSCVESPDMMNVYNGVVVLNEKGEATVELPTYFEALNRDFRYQLTCVGAFAPVYVSEEIHANRFSIAGGKPGLKVSWQVTGIRQDAVANAHRIQPEVEKSPSEKGKFLFPVELCRPESLRIASTKPARSEGARPAPTAGSKHD
jgi:hypothetical protein